MAKILRSLIVKIYKLAKKIPYIKIAVLCGILFVAWATFVFFSFNPKDDPFAKRYSKTLLDKNNQMLSMFINDEEQWHLKSTSPLSQKLKIATLTFEDKNFYSHFGIDIKAIFRSLYLNIKNKKRSGASTISMQTIKLLTKDKRTYFNKIKEMILALRLEWLYSKDEILQMYFDNAPYGGNIVGVSSASYMYFNKSPTSLTWAEASLLAVLPNAPGLIHLKRNNEILLQKRNALLQTLHSKNLFDSDNLSLSVAENLPTIKRVKNLAPHLAFRFKDKMIFSTIDKNKQIMLEDKLKNYHQKMLNLGIQNLAAIIVDTKSSEVLAYAGSQDFLDISNFGQIDGIIAKRSPGSTLKPLLFALSIDDGLMLLESKLVDAPTFFSNFKPQNASKKYYGLISAKDALIKSLNVPFVGLLQDYGYDKFFFNLKDILGFEDSDFERYGLSLILGTKELSIEDIAKIYVGLGNYGEFGDIYYTRNIDADKKHIKPKKRLISKGASYLTLDTMRHLERYGLENYYIDKNIFSWKTGTSYGKKDAWAAGTSPKYTIVVWVGNFSGEANPNIFGLTIAGRLLFDIVNGLDGLGGEFKAPANSLKEIVLDKATGYRYNKNYKNIKTFTALSPKDSKTLRYSPFLENVFVNKAGEEVDSLSKDFLSAKEITKLSLPIALLSYYKEQNVNNNQKIRALKILYPKNNLSIIRTKDFSGKNELIARIANISGENVFWYLDKKYIGSSVESTKILNLNAGIHTLTIINNNTDSDTVSFKIIK